MKMLSFPDSADFQEMRFTLACHACGCHAAFVAMAAERDEPLFLRCCKCGAERRDLAALDDDRTAG